jgi:hypothetical protein
MLDRTQKYVVPVLLAGLALFYVNEIWRSSKGTHPPTIQHRTEHPKYEAKHDNIFSDFWNWTTNDPISFYTSLLAVFTGALVVVARVQIRYLIRADITARRSSIAARRAANAARKSADAADLSARAAIAIELPFIRVDEPDELTKVENIEDDTGGLIWDVETPDLPEFSRLYSLKFRNIGRTTAAPTKLELGWKVVQILSPENPVYTWSRRCDHGTVIPGGNEPYELDCNGFCIVLTAQDRTEIAANAKTLWVFCALTYRDFLDESRVARFCWRWGCPDGVGLYYFYTDEHTPAQYTAKS